MSFIVIQWMTPHASETRGDSVITQAIRPGAILISHNITFVVQAIKVRIALTILLDGI